MEMGRDSTVRAPPLPKSCSEQGPMGRQLVKLFLLQERSGEKIASPPGSHTALSFPRGILAIGCKSW